MRNVERALWFIERELNSDVDLGRVASHCNISPFALARLFVLTTGWPVMRYIRARRLSEAAKALRQGAPDILQVALAAGYGSHEAFTRAFTDLFSINPRQVRTLECLDISLVEPFRMKDMHYVKLAEPRMESRPGFLIAGLAGRFTFEKNEGIVGLWQAFVPYLGNVSGQKGGATYGLCCNPGEDGSFEYIAGVEVSSCDGLAGEFTHFRVSEQFYGVFRHLGHISTIHQTFFTVFNHWLPASEYTLADAPEFEQYSCDFEPSGQTGYVEIWIPLAKA